MNINSFISKCNPSHRVSLDPNSQKMVGYLRTQLSQFNRLYKSGSLTDSNVPGILKIALDLWVIFTLIVFKYNSQLFIGLESEICAVWQLILIHNDMF